MQDIRAVAFDKDGTLFDFHATWAAWAQRFLTGLAGGDADHARALGAAIGFDVDTATYAPDSPVIAGTPGEIAGGLLPLLPDWARGDLIAHMNEQAAHAPLQPAVPLAPLLDHLRAAGIRVGVITNDGEAPARAHLTSEGVLERFDFVAGCDSGYGAKPEPGQINAFATAMGIDPRHILMVGDSLHDLMAGRAAGMNTLGVLTGVAIAEELRPYADAIAPDIGAVPGLIGLAAPA